MKRLCIQIDEAVELAVLQALPGLPTPSRIAGRVGCAIHVMPRPICELIGGYAYGLGLQNACGHNYSYRDDLRALKAALYLAQSQSVRERVAALPTSTESLIRRLFEEDVRETAREAREGYG